MPGEDDHNQIDRVDEEMPDGVSPQSIENLDQEEAEFARVVAQLVKGGMSQQLRTFLSSYSGPLPPPEIIEQYVDIYPNAAEILFEGFKAEGEHRRSMETYALKHDVWQGYLGLASAFLIMLAVIALAAYAVSRDYSISAVILAIGALVALATAFISRQRQQEKQGTTKSEKSTPEIGPSADKEFDRSNNDHA